MKVEPLRHSLWCGFEVLVRELYQPFVLRNGQTTMLTETSNTLCDRYHGVVYTTKEVFDKMKEIPGYREVELPNELS